MFSMSRPRSRACSSVLAASALLSISAGHSYADDAEAGLLAFNNHCRQCHSYKKDDNRLGPSLHGVVGRKAGTMQGFANYSDSLKNSKITWTEDQIDKWITNPEALVPNNNMKPFPGVADAEQRKQIIAFLKSEGGAGDAKQSAK
jgi:cytochrome c